MLSVELPIDGEQCKIQTPAFGGRRLFALLCDTEVKGGVIISRVLFGIRLL